MHNKFMQERLKEYSKAANDPSLTDKERAVAKAMAELYEIRIAREGKGHR